MKLCVDCKHKLGNGCQHPSATVVSLVDGCERQRTCETQRDDAYTILPDSCGIEARFFESKENEAS